MTRTRPINTEAIEAITALKKKQHAWMWMSTHGEAAVVVVPMKADPEAKRFGRLVGEVVAEQGGTDHGIRGMLTRLPSGAFSLSVREAPEAVAPVHAALCQQLPEVPALTILQMDGARIVKALSSTAPAADPFGALGGGDDIWSALM